VVLQTWSSTAPEARSTSGFDSFPLSLLIRTNCMPLSACLFMFSFVLGLVFHHHAPFLVLLLCISDAIIAPAAAFHVLSTLAVHLPEGRPVSAPEKNLAQISAAAAAISPHPRFRMNPTLHYPQLCNHVSKLTPTINFGRHGNGDVDVHTRATRNPQQVTLQLC